MLLLKLVTERRLSFESKNIIFKNFFDINFRQLCYSAKSREVLPQKILIQIFFMIILV